MVALAHAADAVQTSEGRSDNETNPPIGQRSPDAVPWCRLCDGVNFCELIIRIPKTFFQYQIRWTSTKSSGPVPNWLVQYQMAPDPVPNGKFGTGTKT